MKKILQIFLTVSMLVLIQLPSMADTKEMYHTVKTQNIYTKIYTHTILLFPVEIEYASIGNTSFQLDKDEKLDKVIITPLGAGIQTNLVVITKDSKVYSFRVIENDQFEAFDVVKLKTAPEIDYRNLIYVCNRKLIDIDPALKEYINIYDIQDNKTESDKLNIYVKRALTVLSLDKTIYWLRIENKTLEPIMLPVDKLKVKNREVFAVAIEKDEEKIFPGNYVDIYLILNNVGLEANLELKLNIDTKNKEILVTNLPYQKQEFKVFEALSNDYVSVMIDEYAR